MASGEINTLFLLIKATKPAKKPKRENEIPEELSGEKLIKGNKAIERIESLSK
tara:strand:- start:607 stop:765 length:159 start_codon:yes stop_codon:yes gene_type:complete